MDFISRKRLLFSKRHVPRGLAIGVLLTGLVLIIGGLLTYTIPKTITGIQRVGVVLKEQYPKYQESVEKIVEKYRDTEIGALLVAQLEDKITGEEDAKIQIKIAILRQYEVILTLYSFILLIFIVTSSCTVSIFL